MCYRYTNPLFAVRSLKRIYYYTQKGKKVKHYFYNFSNFFPKVFCTVVGTPWAVQKSARA